LVLDYWPSLSNQALDGASTKWFKLTWFSFARSRMRPPLVITGRSAWYIASPSCLPKVLYRYNSFANPTVYGLEKNTKTFRRHHIHVMWFSSFYKGHYLKHYIPNLMKPNKRIEKKLHKPNLHHLHTILCFSNTCWPHDMIGKKS